MKIVLLDVKNLIYRSVCANSHGGNDYYDDVSLAFKLFGDIIVNINPDAAYLYWDCPRKEVWRLSVDPEYKKRDPPKDPTVPERLRIAQEHFRAVADVVGLTSFYVAGQEADDLVYATVTAMSEHELVIVSSDKDYEQIPYRFGWTSLFDPFKMQYKDKSDVDPVKFKCLVGDKSDNIIGYKGIGPVKGRKISSCSKSLHDFLRSNDRMTYFKNMMLVDMSLNPKLMYNVAYILLNHVQSFNFDPSVVRTVAIKHKLRGLIENYDKTILPFSTMASARSG